jgi:hypothetical protein
VKGWIAVGLFTVALVGVTLALPTNTASGSCERAPISLAFQPAHSVEDPEEASACNAAASDRLWQAGAMGFAGLALSAVIRAVTSTTAPRRRRAA